MTSVTLLFLAVVARLAHALNVGVLPEQVLTASMGYSVVGYQLRGVGFQLPAHLAGEKVSYED
ncbi:hypothetical protein SAMN04515648_4542 [Phyllobacterium sp. CL33Tsu]|nr:hypothetical protein SAMN04515648_4542 [Phyllobacterium sp. CL33Tsu]